MVIWCQVLVRGDVSAYLEFHAVVASLFWVLQVAPARPTGDCLYLSLWFQVHSVLLHPNLILSHLLTCHLLLHVSPRSAGNSDVPILHHGEVMEDSEEGIYIGSTIPKDAMPHHHVCFISSEKGNPSRLLAPMDLTWNVRGKLSKILHGLLVLLWGLIRQRFVCSSFSGTD